MISSIYLMIIVARSNNRRTILHIVYDTDKSQVEQLRVKNQSVCCKVRSFKYFNHILFGLKNN